MNGMVEQGLFGNDQEGRQDHRIGVQKTVTPYQESEFFRKGKTIG
jgi:hypothetical protein